jgi:polyribonucleotide nucleotidyltransferase
LIDRPIRPLFVDGFKNEVLVMCTVLSHDLVNDPDIVAMIAAFFTVSGLIKSNSDNMSHCERMFYGR